MYAPPSGTTGVSVALKGQETEKEHFPVCAGVGISTTVRPQKVDEVALLGLNLNLLSERLQLRGLNWSTA